ncbi:hypothetical protein LLH23_20075 [bacterium]|nr:hypothetical protein [bacterium]
MFRLPVRQYRCVALPGQAHDETNFGHVHREIELDPTATAFVTVDLWNMGWEEEPLAPELGRDAEYHFIGLGKRAALEAKRRVEENLAPALAAARAAGLTIIHCNSEAVVKRYPACLVEVEERVSDEGRVGRRVLTPPEVADSAREDTRAHAERSCARGDTRAHAAAWPPPAVREAVLAEYLQVTWGLERDEQWNRMREVCDFPAPVRPQPGDCCVYQQAAFDRIARERKITTLIYAGFLLGHCLLDKPGGLRSTAAIWNSPGYRALVLRDCTLAQESATSIEGFQTTEAFIFWLEASTIPTATAGDLVAAVE